MALLMERLLSLSIRRCQLRLKIYQEFLGTHKPEKKGFLLIYHKCTHIVLSITPQPPRRSQKTLPQRTTFFYLN